MLFKNPFLVKMMLIIALFLFLTPQLLHSQEKLLDVLSDELNRNMDALQKEEVKPYYMNYRVDEVVNTRVVASFGNLTASSDSKENLLTVMVRVGSPDLDNYHEIRGGMGFSFGGMGTTKMPLDDNEDAVRQQLWKTTNKKYKDAIDKFAKVKANVAVKVAEEDKSDDFSKQKVGSYYEAPLSGEATKFDAKLWEEKVKKYSKPFLNHPDIFNGVAGVMFKYERKYFVSTEGAKIAQNMVYIRLFISGSIKADDGMVLPLNKSYFAYTVEGLPSDAKVLEDVTALVEKLKELKDAPLVEPYTGPCLLSGEASAQCK